MKQINVYFDDDEHKKLKKIKDKLSWHDFILKLLEIDKEKPNERKNIL
jgi:predicted CopG family antitoxin